MLQKEIEVEKGGEGVERDGGGEERGLGEGEGGERGATRTVLSSDLPGNSRKVVSKQNY